MSAALDDTQIRKQDAGYVYTYAGRNIIGKNMLWDFFRENWDTIFARYLVFVSVMTLGQRVLLLSYQIPYEKAHRRQNLSGFEPLGGTHHIVVTIGLLHNKYPTPFLDPRNNLHNCS